MPEPKVITYAEAVRDGLAESMAACPEVFLMGEGIADHGDFFGTTTGLLERFGRERVVEMPVAENGMTGVAIGAAMMGQRPVMCLQRVEFVMLALEQIFNNAAKIHYATNGRYKVPMVVRLVIGRGWGQGAQHSQSLESVFGHFPGLKVVMPALVTDAKGMLSAAIEDDNAVVSIEHRWLHSVEGEVPDGYFVEALDGPRVRRPGNDVTIVASSFAVVEALTVAAALERAGISAEVIDLRVVRPLELGPIRESVRRTGRLITVDTGWITYGVGAEIVAGVVETNLADLAAAPRRLGLAAHPTPASMSLVGDYYPSPEALVDAVAVTTSMSAERVAAVKSILAESRGNLPIDVPNPMFRGPF